MTLWKNGVFHSLETSSKNYHQMMTDNEFIIGFDDEINHLTPQRIIDLNGAHLYPGFVYSHLHLLGYGRKLIRPSLAGINQKEAMIAFIKHHPDVIIFEGYEGSTITKQDLDDLSDDRYLILRHRDYHSATVNSKVLNQMQIDSQTGILTEALATLAMTTFGQVSNQKLEDMFKEALHHLYAFGITGGHSDDLAYFNGFNDTLNAMENVLKKHPFRTHLLMHHDILDDYLNSGRLFLDQHEYLQLGAIKLFYDGTFSSRTAKVSKPYRDDRFGIRIFEKQTLENLLIKIRKHKLPLAIHVIGDQGLSEVLDLLEKYPVSKGLHDRIIHASLWQQKDLMRAQNLPLIFDIQPQFLSSDLPQILDLFKEKPQHLYPWKTLMSKHLVLCGGSDAPVEIPDPRLGMYDAIFRETGETIYNQKECLTRFEALKLYTINANIPTYKHNRGLLKKGYVADFTVLKEDVLTIPKSRFKDNSVKMTVINEHIVYQE